MIKRNKTFSSGESLSETLIAALIISLAMIMLFSSIKVGIDLMDKSRDGYQNYNDELNKYEESQAAYAVEYHKVASVSITKPAPYSFDMSPHKYNW